MSIYFRNIYLFLSIGIFSLFLVACNKEPSDSPYVEKDPQTTVLIYAVATNSLSSNLNSDKKEILQAAPYLDLEQNNVLLFETTYNNPPRLLKLEKNKENEDDFQFTLIKEYSEDISSLNPERISEIIEYVASAYNSKNYGLIFWSHSTASQPYMKGLTTASHQTTMYSFGQDKNSALGQTFEININDLANVLPDHFFDFIWFDSCYMSNIETIYQFRDKCDFFIGYPTEVVDEGMPYHLTLPLLAKENPDIIGAAETFMNYFTNDAAYKIGTIAVTDMSNLEVLASFCEQFYTLGVVPDASSLFKYTRSTTGPFYDFGDYSKEISNIAGTPLSNEEWNQVLNKAVIYKAATMRDFNGHIIPIERYSGISTHIYDFNNLSESEQFYRSLDWFQRVFK